jgi:anti-sigma regulatory factor (Ser/Thr protein kinase)
MPYVVCRLCGLRSYLAAGHASRPRCPRCDEALNVATVGGGDSLRHVLAHDVDAPQAARKALEQLAEELRGEALDVAQLLVSELVTNAVRHGAPSLRDDGIVLAAFVDHGTLHVEVCDGGRGFDGRPADGGALRTSGWGLVLVDRLADRWGVSEEPDTRVWFELGLGSDGQGAGAMQAVG